MSLNESRLNQLGGQGMDDAITTITRSGASGSLLADFKAIEDASSSDGQPKYAKTPVMAWLAKMIVGQAGGPNKDAPLFELCHLVYAVDALSNQDNKSDNRSIFFLSADRAVPNLYRAAFESRLSAMDWRLPGMSADEKGVSLEYQADFPGDVDDGEEGFEIRFGRMPFLSALFEFLLGLDGYDYYQELNELFDDLSGGQFDRDAVKKASNRISARLRQYRRDHLSRVQYDEKFDRIAGFLNDRADDKAWRIDDPAILEFWLDFSESGDFKTYKLVFDSFVTFMRSLDEAGGLETLESAASIGTDKEAHEGEPDDSAGELWVQGDWQSPLPFLDDEPLVDINFLKKESERKPIESLMHYGPYAVKLPLAFLRLESFGPVQAAITNDLQIKRGSDSIRQRLTCDEADRYREKRETFDKILHHVRNLQKAVYYVLTNGSEIQEVPESENVVALRSHGADGLAGGPAATLFEKARNGADRESPDFEGQSELMLECRRAFSNIYRKGFDEDSLSDPDNLAAYRVGAGVMVTIADQMEKYAAHLENLGGEEELDELFDHDRKIFSKQFGALYGATA